MFQSREFLLSRREYLNMVVDSIERRGDISCEFDKVAVGPRQILRVKIDVARSHGRDDLAFVHARDHMLAAEAAAEEDVEYQTDDRQKDQGYHP